MENPESNIDRRRDPRAEVHHPIQFKLFSPEIGSPLVDGYLKDLSLRGARLGLNDRYGQLTGHTLKGLRTKLQIAVPDGDPLQLLCVVSWARPGRAKKTEVEVGLEFEAIEPWQLEKVEQFLSVRHTDQTMFWTMWDAYEEGERRHGERRQPDYSGELPHGERRSEERRQ